MGGLDSSVQAYTRHIFLESAFSPLNASLARPDPMALQTDAAHRFERGVDFNLPRQAMERATTLLLEIVGGEAGPVIEEVQSLPEDKAVSTKSRADFPYSRHYHEC